MKPGDMQLYGTMTAIWQDAQMRFVSDGGSAGNARTGPMMRLLREHLAGIAQDAARGVVVAQYDDYIHHDLRSVGFCRRRGEAPAVRLIPDVFFLDSQGYGGLRAKAEREALPSWAARRDTVFWRGAASTNGIGLDGSRIERLDEIPRVAMCLQLRKAEKVDVAIYSAWGFHWLPPAEATEWYRAQGVLRPPLPPADQAGYRLLIDIDGVASAWGFFEKLLTGSCILKVASPFEQWFSGDIEPWVHYVPVSADLSDLEERIDWCRRNDAEAEAIGRRGLAYALGFSHADGVRVVIEALRLCFTPF